jgi:hypothetical protein
MRSKKIVRRVAGLAVAATLSLGVASPVGFAQYAPSPTPTPTTGNAKLKKCIKHAKKKYKRDATKRKKAIKKCKKKFA